MALPVDQLDDLVSLERGEVDRRIRSGSRARTIFLEETVLLARNLSNFF